METMRYSNRLAFLGVVGGVLIALGFPFVILYFGTRLSGMDQMALVILGLLIGAALAVVAAVVGITIPTSISGGIDVDRLAGCCDEDEGGDEAGCCESVQGNQDAGGPMGAESS